MQATDASVVGQVMHARTTVLWCAMSRADGGGGMRWPELMVEGGMNACLGPCRSLVWASAPSSDLLRWGAIVFLYLKKNYCSGGPCRCQQTHCDSSTVTVLWIFPIFHSTNHKDTRQQGYMYIPLLILTLTAAILGTNNVLITLNDQTAIAKSVDNNWLTRTWCRCKPATDKSSPTHALSRTRPEEGILERIKMQTQEKLLIMHFSSRSAPAATIFTRYWRTMPLGFHGEKPWPKHNEKQPDLTRALALSYKARRLA
jgi:hypothetical protein